MESLSELPSLSDCVAIVVMGATGSGKSTFISLLADQDVEVSHGLQSHTIRGRPYSFEDPDTREQVMLMDMPGFDDTSRSDAEILRELSYSLAMLYRMNVRLAGLVYLHRISDPRMSGSAIKNLRLFKALCGEQNYSHVVLATTMWTEIEEERAVGQRREQELRNTYWADLVQRGSKMVQHNGTRESALDIVRALTTSERSRSVTLAIQRELVVEGRTLDDTDVGRVLSQEIESDRTRVVRDAQDLDSSLEEAEREGDRDTAAALRAERRAAKAKAARLARNKEALGIGLEQLGDEERPRYAATLKQEKRRRKARHVYTSYDRPSPHPESDSETTPEADGARAAGYSRRERRVYVAEDRRGPPGRAINERSSSLGKTRREPELVLQFLMYFTT